MNKYRTGDIARLLSMTNEGVRFMEKEGIISSVRDETNGYRYYDYDQFVRLKRARSYRTMGYSLAEAKKMTQNLAENEVEEALMQKLEELAQKEKEIKKFQFIIQEQYNSFLLAKNHIIDVQMNPEFIALETKRNGSAYSSPFLSGNEWNKYVSSWVLCMPTVKMFAWYSEEDPERKGMVITFDDFQKSGLTSIDDLVHFPASRCVHGAVEAPVFEVPDFQPFYSWADENHFILSDKKYCIMQMTYQTSSGRTMCVHEVFIPIIEC